MNIGQIILISYIATAIVISPYTIYMIINDKKDGEKQVWWLCLIYILIMPLFIPLILIAWIRDICKYGCRLTWRNFINSGSLDRWIGIKEARLKRIDKEINGWPTDPVERAKCPRLRLRYENEFECNGYIENTQNALIYVANEECPELEDLFENHIDILNNWAEPLHLQIVYIPSVFKAVHNKEVQKYRMPWTDDIEADNIEVGNDYMFRYLIHPEDRERMRHGFYFSQAEVRSDHYVKTYICRYYDLLPPSKRSLSDQLEDLKIKLCNDADWLAPGLNCTMKDTAGDEPDDFADNEFHSQVFLESIDDLMEEIKERVKKLRQRGVAEHLLMELVHPETKLSKLVITKQFQIQLPDYQNMEINMEPLVKAVYFLFLNHPEGIRFKDLPDYREELTNIYLKLKPNGLTDRVKKSIEDVTNPLLNSINEKCARIRGAFVGKFDNSLAKHYYIDGRRGEPKKISLPRELVIWE